VTGLSDSSAVSRSGSTTLFKTLWKDGYGYRPFGIESVFSVCRPGERATVTVDEHYVALAAPDEKVDVPCIVGPQKEFDPVKEGWPLVFADEFEGDSIDWSNWYHRGRNCSGVLGKHTRLDGKGVLEIEADYGKGGEKLESASLRSKREFVYGYFEAKVKLTRQNGWWAAFWMYGRNNSDPFVDGLEIDIFEDYYTRKKTPQGKNRLQLDHNLHMYLGSQLKSWNYNSELSGDIDDWVVIGCKLTPFEISYYVDGKLLESSANHSNWPSVTYDAINHAAATAPLHLIVSGQVMGKSLPWFDKTGATFPETFKVDYVRAYAMPQDKAKSPKIAWTGAAAKDDGMLKFFDSGDKMRFEVEASPADAGQELAGVYLYDAGYLISHKTEPPYVFDVEMTKEWYGRTRYMGTGRQKVVPDLAKAPHSFVAFVQDRSGAVSHTAKVIRRHPRFFNPATRPFEGVAQKIPGKLTLWRYDEGGQGVSCFDTTKGNAYAKSGQSRRTEGDVDCTAGELASIMPGEWVNYTVDIKTAGKYRIEMRYGTAMQGHHAVYVVLDGETAGALKFDYTGDADSWALDKTVAVDGVDLPSGRHVISLYSHAQLNIGSLNFICTSKIGERR
jgi:beta-glucanase (GH16 family)